jgi:hypothetical protein
MRESIDPMAGLIAALAENMSDRNWAQDIIYDAVRIMDYAKDIIRIAEQRLPGES